MIKLPIPLPYLQKIPIIATLANGLRIATLELPEEPATACVTVGCGSRFDPDESPGISYTIWRRACAIHMGYSLTKEVTSALLNAVGNDICEPLEHLANFVQQTGYFEHATVVSPRGITEQVGKGEEKVGDVLENLREVAFKNNPLGRPGDRLSTTDLITKKQIKDFVSTHYTAPRMVVTVTGDVKHEEVVRDVNKFFMHLSSDPTTASQLVAKSLATFTATEERILDDNQSLATFAIGFHGASTTDPDFWTLMVIVEMLGSLNQEPAEGKYKGTELGKLVDVNKLAKTIGADSESYQETGLFKVHASAEPHCLDDLAEGIMSSIRKLSYDVQEEVVVRARFQAWVSYIRKIFTTPLAADIGEQIIVHGRRIPLEEVFLKVMAVEATDVKRVARRFFLDKDVAIVATGPIKKLPDYDWFRASTRSRN